MVENRDASASNASADEGPEDTNAGTKEPAMEPAADDAAGGQKFIRIDALQQMILDSLSERNQVLRDLRDRYERGEGDFPHELFGRWSCSIVTLKADLEAQDDEELIKDLEVQLLCSLYAFESPHVHQNAMLHRVVVRRYTSDT